MSNVIRPNQFKIKNVQDDKKLDCDIDLKFKWLITGIGIGCLISCLCLINKDNMLETFCASVFGVLLIYLGKR